MEHIQQVSSGGEVTVAFASGERLAKQTSGGESSAWLDLIRGLAAAVVVLTHLRGFFFAKWSDLEPESQTTVNFGIFFITRLGREAVIVFFVLSGYLVGGNALRSFFRGEFAPRKYWAHRLARLYTVLIPALAITALTDWARRAGLGRTDFESDLGVKAAVTNLFFLQGVAGPCYGSNSPLWSLAYEFWFYVFGGYLISALAVRLHRGLRLLSVLVVAASLWIMWPDMAFYLPMWCFGAGLRMWRGKLHSCLGGLFALLFLAGLVVSTRHLTVTTDYLVAAGVGGVIVWLGNREMRFAGLRRGAHILASISFTAYAIHYPVVGWLVAWLAPVRRKAAGWFDWAEWSGLALLVFAICWLMYFCFERHTGRVRKWLEAKS